jgi:hypothetical protein
MILLMYGGQFIELSDNERVRLIYTILAPRAGAANPAQSTEREDFTNVRITPLKVLWIQTLNDRTGYVWMSSFHNSAVAAVPASL